MVNNSYLLLNQLNREALLILIIVYNQNYDGVTLRYDIYPRFDQIVCAVLYSINSCNDFNQI